MMTRRSPRAGVALLDVLLATTLLATAGVGLVSHVRATSEAVATSAAREAELSTASSALSMLAVLRPDELRSRVGSRVRGPLRVEVREIRRGLFLVVGYDTSSGAELLRTQLAPADGRMNVE